MSYFMTLAGDISSLRLEDISGFRLIPVSKAPKYLQILAAEIEAVDGSPLFLIEDGWSGTSHDIIVEAENDLNEFGTFDGTVLLKLMQRFAQNGNPFRIWYALDNPDAHNAGEVFSSLDAIVDSLKEQASQSPTLQARFLPQRQ